MARLGTFDREIKVATAGLEPAAIRRKLADVARAERDRVLNEQSSRGGAAPTVRTAVNGREGLSEEQVEPPGPIVYVFDYAPEIAFFALDAARRLSPVASGKYRDAWFAMAGGKKVAVDAIPPGADLIITNDRPYARKIQVGAMKRMTVPPGIVERLRQLVLNRYGNAVNASVRFITLSGGYVLKGRGRGKRGTRKDVRAGQQIAYPALVIKAR